MKVCGFSFIKNAVKYDYPIREAILSVLPLCDHFILAVGDSEDMTIDLVKDLDPKIEILHTIWNPALRTGGRVLADETNKAFGAIPSEYDWAIYIQGDEAIHEEDFDQIRTAMKKYLHDQAVDGFLFEYQHFYGSFDYVATSPKWYRREVRIIRNDKNIFSYRDAQGFRKIPNKKLQVIPLKARVFHYGWVRPPHIMRNKINDFHKFWHDKDELEKRLVPTEEFDYGEVSSIEKFCGTHPMVMQERIRQCNWTFDKELQRKKPSISEIIRLWIEQKTGWLPGSYKNYKTI